MAFVPAATSSPKTEARPAFAARSRWPSSSAFTRASQCGTRRRMLRPRRRRRRRDARGAQIRLRADGPGLPRLPQRMRHRDAFGALTGERSSLCSAIGRARFYSETVDKARDATARAIGGGDDGAPLRVSKARPNALAISAAGVAMRVYCPPRRGPRRGPGLQEPHRPRLGSLRSPSRAMSRRSGAAQLDAFGK